MSIGKASILRAAGAGTKNKPVQSSVVTPLDSSEIQVKFLSGQKSAPEKHNETPVHITEELPDYLL